MKALSLKLNEEIFSDLEKMSHKFGIPRNRYINLAIDFYNRLHKRKMLKEQIVKESKAVYGESMDVLKEFEKIEDFYG